MDKQPKETKPDNERQERIKELGERTDDFKRKVDYQLKVLVL